MRLAHLSDLHVLELDSPKPWEFLNKRAIGGANLALNRGKRHSADVIRKALRMLESLEVDLLAPALHIGGLGLVILHLLLERSLVTLEYADPDSQRPDAA